ncbi:YdcF family protein [Pseudomonadota bacterium]
MNKKLKAIGWDGLAMLAVSNVIVFASMGITLLLLLGYVLRIAVKAPAAVKPMGCVVIPGKCLKRGAPDAEFIRRLDRVAAVYNTPMLERAEIKIFVLGGVTDGNTVSESSVGQRYLQQLGVPPACVVLEDKSNNTLENFRFAKALINSEEMGEAVVVSSRYHLARCGVMAKSLGIPYELCAAEAYFSPGPRNLLNIALEAYRLHWYFCGRYWAMITRNKKMLAKLQ